MKKKEKEISDTREIESIISHSDVCRIALSFNDIPYIVTMNFGYKAGLKPCLFFHCANEGRKLEMIRQNNYVCFEMDTDHELNIGPKACESGMRYKSIIGYGYIYIVTDNDEKKEGLNSIMFHYAGKDEFSFNENTFERTTVLRLDISEITGKKS